jgi:hypothetical protein
LSARLSAFNDFMWWSEETSANLSLTWGRITKIIERFAKLERIWNIYVAACRVEFFEWILRIADLTQLLLGFIVTARGLAWYHRLPDVSLPESAFFSEWLVLQQVRRRQCHFQELRNDRKREIRSFGKIESIACDVLVRQVTEFMLLIVCVQVDRQRWINDTCLLLIHLTERFRRTFARCRKERKVIRAHKSQLSEAPLLMKSAQEREIFFWTEWWRDQHSFWSELIR